MANCSRDPKSGRDWSRIDLDAYRITIRNQSPQKFFGYKPNKLPNNLDPNILTASELNDDLSDATYRLLQHIKLVPTNHTRAESVPLDANREILRAIGFEERGNILRTHFSLPFLIASDGSRRAEPDLCLTHDDLSILLIVQLQDETSTSGWDPEARALASAIAAFRYNNAYRDEMGLHQLKAMMIPALTVNGTRPWFYKICVTEDLSHDVAAGRYPAKEVIVHRCVVGRKPVRSSYKGMEYVDFREEILMFYEAFRKLAKQFWENHDLT